MSRGRFASPVLIGRLLLIAIHAVLVAACGGSMQIVDPTPQIFLSVDGWSVTIQTTAVTGPDFCVHTPNVGTVFQGAYDVAWEGDTVSFLPPDPIDWDSFTAHLTGSQFAARNPPSRFGACTNYLQASDLEGSFSANKNSFTAIEHWYFTLDSGDVKTVTFSWSGVRR